MEFDCFHPGNLGLRRPKTWSRAPIDETPEPKQGPEGFDVLPSHRLYHWILSSRNPPLATMPSISAPVGPFP